VSKRTFPHDGNYDAHIFPTIYHLYVYVYVPHNDILGRTDFPHNALSPQCIVGTYRCSTSSVCVCVGPVALPAVCVAQLLCDVYVQLYSWTNSCVESRAVIRTVQCSSTHRWHRRRQSSWCCCGVIHWRRGRDTCIRQWTQARCTLATQTHWCVCSQFSTAGRYHTVPLRSSDDVLLSC